MEQTPAEQTAGAVRAELARKQIKQRELAAHLGYPKTNVNRRLNGEVAWTVTELVKVAEFLNVPLSTLLPTLSAVA